MPPVLIFPLPKSEIGDIQAVAYNRWRYVYSESLYLR